MPGTVPYPGRHAASASPRVSVVMPTYDPDAFLPAAVDSLLAQVMADW